ncbi:MAG: L-serine ammonia-lyase, iron-sulfur-dependent, subunit alpha [Candidatus Hodarchaeales archaeon]|jgi:L-serine dehydratase
MVVNKYPSIFNDVIGPIMRGPSSSHCAASVRIGRMARDLMGGNVQDVLIEFDPKGSLSTTHESQGSDMGLCGGLLGWNAYDERLMDSTKAMKDAGINITIEIKELKIKHPNTYKLSLKNTKEYHEIVAISTGGGMIELVEIDGVKVSMIGDCYETLIYTKENKLVNYLQEINVTDEIIINKGKDITIIEVKGQKFLGKQLLTDISKKFNFSTIKELNPILPVLSNKGTDVPFSNCDEMLLFNEDKNLDLWELAVHYESIRGEISAKEVFNKMKNICEIMQTSILDGIKGTVYHDRILGCQSGKFKEKMEAQKLLEGGILNQMILFITAMMEVKSSMGIIVASPTAGSCGTLPGTLIGATSLMELSEGDLVKAMLAASMIGIFLAIHSTFSAEIGGCQAECGSASGMAAAGLVYLGKGSLRQALSASSMALQNIFGMVCDPVANRVEVPCLGKNVISASNALSCANMALANFDAVLPLDEVIDAMDKVGKSIPHELKCTALGGLSVTRTSRIIENKLINIKDK